MPLQLEPYRAQQEAWPRSGRCILAQFDDDSVVVYQAYRPSIGHWAAEHGSFGGEFQRAERRDETRARLCEPIETAGIVGPAVSAFRPAAERAPGFSLSRMSWIKPNFLWMMFRSGWGTKEGQEVTLAVRLRRAAFDEVLAQAVPSSFGQVTGVYADEAAWQAAVAGSDVRLQWDPDHHPSGAPLERRAIQLGLRGEVLRRYAAEWLLGIEDVSAFVAEQRQHAHAAGLDRLVTPRERVYPVSPETARRLGL